MPHLRMFLGEQHLDEVLIPEVLLQQFSLNRLVDEEKQKLIKKHSTEIKKKREVPSFVLEFVPSKTNYFFPLQLKKDINDQK